MKELATRLLCALGAPALFRFRNRRRLLILMYHGVIPAAGDRPTSPPYWHQLPVADFRRQMEWVARKYRVLPLDEALAGLLGGTLPPRACAITFDDGFLNDRTTALPVLESLRLPATVFLATGVIGTDRVLWPDRLQLAFARTAAGAADLSALGLGRLPLATPDERGAAAAACANRLKDLPRAEKDARLAELLAALGEDRVADPGDFRMLTWDDVRAMEASGLVRFAAHTVTHEILSRLPDDEVASQVRDSHEEVTRRLGNAPRVFAYPNGRARDFDERSRAAVRACGIPFSLSTVEGLASRDSDPLALSRMCIGSDLTFARFRLLVSGALLALRGDPDGA